MDLLPTQNKEERGLRKSQRTSTTNLMRNNISPETEIVRKTYELNADKAIYKKMDTCTAEHLRTELKAKKNNIRIYLSTSAYELVKKRLPDQLSGYINKDNLDMTTERGLDSNNAEVELRFRIVNKLKSGKPGSQLKCTINCYHTSTSKLIDGSKTDLFIDNILPCIEKEVHSQEDNLR